MSFQKAFISGVLFFAAICPVFAQGGIDRALDEANEAFGFEGKPIHPGLVEEFSSSIADSGSPTTISIDVAAEHGNEYFYDDVSKGDSGSIVLKKDDGEYFYYKWLGRLNNGLHVLEVGEGGGGSGVYTSLYFVKFDKGQGSMEDGKPYDRLLMSIVRMFSLGDRDDGKITVQPNEVVVSKSRYRDQETVIKFS